MNRTISCLVLVSCLCLTGCPQAAKKGPPAGNPPPTLQLHLGKDFVLISVPGTTEPGGYRNLDVGNPVPETKPLNASTNTVEMKGKLELLEKRQMVITLDFNVQEAARLEIRNDGVDNLEVNHRGARVEGLAVDLTPGKHAVVVKGVRQEK
jgi:hypothetical protein